MDGWMDGCYKVQHIGDVLPSGNFNQEGGLNFQSISVVSGESLFSSSQCLGVEPGLSLMNSRPIASFSNLCGPIAEAKKPSVSCLGKHSRAVGVLSPSPSEHRHVTYRCWRSCEEEGSTESLSRLDHLFGVNAFLRQCF